MARTQRERDEIKREEKLEEIKEQVDAGRLSIRQMTDEERAKYAPKPRQDPPAGRRRSR